MLRGMEGKWLKMASERRTGYKKYSYTGCDGFARYSERVSADIAGIYRLRFPPKKQKTGTADSCYGT